MMKYLYLLLLLLALGLSCNRQEEDLQPFSEEPDLKPSYKNIILMIGDGMGLTQITGAHTVNGGALNMLSVRHIGIQSTHCADRYVTDSGASSTAMACGKKTNYYYVGVDPEGNPLESILETAEATNRMTGLITTTQIVHATPAAFYAHQTDRYQYEAIALELVNSGVDYFAGGGKKYFDQRSDGLNLIDTLIKKGYEVVNDPMASEAKGKTAVFIADDIPLSIPEGRDDVLKRSVLKSIEYLSQHKEGFFLMVEGGQIDWAGEENDQEYLMAEMLDFDAAIGVALDFARSEGNTLVVITGDHETAGFALTGGSVEDNTIQGQFVTWLHTGAMVPVFALGPGCENFLGVYENTAIYEKMANFFGF